MEVHKDFPAHPENYQRGRAQPVSFLVFHYVGATGGARNNARYYGRTPGIGASAHYFVDHAPGAEVWQSVPEQDTAWHCGAKSYRHPTCRNANSIGIEMCCHQDAKAAGTSTRPQWPRRRAWAGRVMTRYGIPLENVLRHYDVTGKLCPPGPLIDEDKWAAFKARLEDTMTQEQFNAMMDVYLAQSREKPVSDWAKDTWAQGYGRRGF